MASLGTFLLLSAFVACSYAAVVSVVGAVPGVGARRRRRPQPAAAELLDGDPSAVAVHRLRRHDDSVRVLHRGADYGPSRRLVAARGAPLDDGQLAVPVAGPHTGDDL